MKQIVLAMVFVLLAGTMAHAQSVPPLVNYQGLLTDAAGNPQTGTKKLEFNLYDAATGGNKVWGPQVFDSVPLVNGMFNVILGTTDAGGKSIADAFSAKDRYLGMKVDDGTELTPRQQILSTPFAIAASTVQGPHLYVDPETGNVGLGTTEPQGKLDMNNGAIVNVDWERSGLPTDVISCYKSGSKSGGAGGYTFNFTEADCGGTLPDESYIGVARTINICGGMTVFSVNSGTTPGIWIWSSGLCGSYVMAALYIKVRQPSEQKRKP